MFASINTRTALDYGLLLKRPCVDELSNAAGIDDKEVDW